MSALDPDDFAYADEQHHDAGSDRGQGADPEEKPTHVPCCSAHSVPMTCARYRRTHFVEVRPCCATDAALLMNVVDDALDRDFDAEVSAGPIVDNASDRLYTLGELEGDLCPGCGDRIPGDIDQCDGCMTGGAA